MGSGHDLEALTRPGVDNDFAIGASLCGLIRPDADDDDGVEAHMP
jgi:hypothetical protein